MGTWQAVLLWLNYSIMERFVQHLEHPMQEPDQAGTAVPATMVERAFQGLDLLMTVEAGGEYLYPHVSAPRGTHVPFISAATGRLVLASWSAEQRRHWLQKHELPRFTEASITDSEQFLKEVEKTATTGLAIDHISAIGRLTTCDVSRYNEMQKVSYPDMWEESGEKHSLCQG